MNTTPSTVKTPHTEGSALAFVVFRACGLSAAFLAGLWGTACARWSAGWCTLKKWPDADELSSCVANFGVYRVALSGASRSTRRWPDGGFSLVNTVYTCPTAPGRVWRTQASAGRAGEAGRQPISMTFGRIDTLRYSLSSTLWGRKAGGRVACTCEHDPPHPLSGAGPWQPRVA